MPSVQQRQFMLTFELCTLYNSGNHRYSQLRFEQLLKGRQSISSHHFPLKRKKICMSFFYFVLCTVLGSKYFCISPTHWKNMGFDIPTSLQLPSSTVTNKITCKLKNYAMGLILFPLTSVTFQWNKIDPTIVLLHMYFLGYTLPYVDYIIRSCNISNGFHWLYSHSYQRGTVVASCQMVIITSFRQTTRSFMDFQNKCKWCPCPDNCLLHWAM